VCHAYTPRMSALETPSVRVHSLRPLEAERFLRTLLDLRIEFSSDGEGSPVPADADILIGGRPSREDMEACPRLRMLIVPYAGIPEATRELMLDFPHVAVHNLHHNAASVAELALALLLSAAKRLIPADRALRRGDWSMRYAAAGDVQLDGKSALVLGCGAIGTRIGRACNALGMRVLGVCRRPSLSARVDAGVEIHGPDALPDLLPRANVLFVSLPLVPATRGLLGAREFELLPEDAVLVNIARGAIVNECALYEALAEGRIGAAGLDVWYRYPREAAERTSTLPSALPFYELDNVVLSPHRGGAFNHHDLERLRAEHLARLLNAAARGDPVTNRVDVDAGY